MKTNLKIIHYLFYLLVAVVCIFCFINWGWSYYSTITERPGLWSSMHEYYNMSKEFYSLYCFLIAAASLIFLILPINFMMKGHVLLLNRIYIYFLLFVALIIVSEIVISYRYVGKG